MGSGPEQAVRLRSRSGERRDVVLEPGLHAELQVECLHAGMGGVVEVVGAYRDGKRLSFVNRHGREAFVPAGDRAAVRDRVIALNRARMEAFITPATLTTPAPGNDAVGELARVWVDIDEPAHLERLRGFARPPHLVIESGGSGGMHAYFRLSFPVPAAEGERINRKLAHHVGGDLVSANRGRLMRLAGSVNYKRRPPRWCRVVMCDLARAPYDPTELADGLEDPREVPPPSHSRRDYDAEDPLEEIAPPVYFEAIAGITVPERGGHVSCPRRAHADVDPSCFVYPSPGAGWTCFSCGATGNAPDLVSALKGGPTGRGLRGDAFKQAHRRALRALGLEPPARAGERKEAVNA